MNSPYRLIGNFDVEIIWWSELQHAGRGAVSWIAFSKQLAAEFVDAQALNKMIPITSLESWSPWLHLYATVLSQIDYNNGDILASIFWEFEPLVIFNDCHLEIFYKLDREHCLDRDAASVTQYRINQIFTIQWLAGTNDERLSWLLPKS